MDYRYTMFDPTKNITLLVETPVPRASQAAVARLLLQSEPTAEQVGFLEPAADPRARARLQMMGGEFCGNAALSAAAFLAAQGGEVLLEVSGAPQPVSCSLRTQEGGWRGSVSLPLPRELFTVSLPTEEGTRSYPAVRFPGIVHCIVSDLSDASAEAAIRPLAKILAEEACGILLFSEAAASFRPLIYVASTDTAVWESGCGSGSAALGCYLALRDGCSRLVSLRQPGGTIEVAVTWENGAVSALSITGNVRRMRSASLSLPL